MAGLGEVSAGCDLTPHFSSTSQLPRGQHHTRGCGSAESRWGQPLTPTVGEAVEQVAVVAHALEAARRVDAHVVAGPVEGALVDVCIMVGAVEALSLRV